MAMALHLTPEAAGVFAATAGGAALLPDVDTPTSAVSHAGGWLFAAPLWLSRRLAVEHRGLTHTLAASGALSLGVFAAGHLFAQAHGWLPAYWPIRIVIPALMAMLAVRSVLTFGSRASWRLGFKRHRRHLLTALAGVSIGYLGYHLGTVPHFALGMALAVFVGYLSHLLLDGLMGGVPLLFPFTGGLSRRVTLGHFRTEGLVDRLLGVAFLAVTAYLFFRLSAGPATVSQVRHHLPL